MVMQKTAIRERNWPLVGLVGLGVLVVALTVLGISRTNDLNSANNALSGIYEKAFYETCELTESMAVNLNKLTVASGGARETILSDIIKQAQGAESNLALLPLGSTQTSSTIKYVNQIGDFSESLMRQLAQGGDITDDQYSTITQLSESAAQLTIGLGDLLDRYEAGEVTFSGQASTEQDLTPITNPATDYPVLLYDGPFSDGAKGANFMALEGMSEVTGDDATRLLKEYVGADAVTYIHLDGESVQDIPCYDFSLTANGYNMSASVTKQGGRVLYLLCSDDVKGQNLSVSDCMQKAQAFLLSRGYGTMDMNYYAQYDGILTINYAATQNNVVLYPDLVKLQISMENGAIIGVEAGNYLRNHVERTLALPAISETDATKYISPRLSVESVTLCVIPVGLSERMCYEVSATSGADTYLIYVDAMTGEEVEIMQVVADGTGTLVM
jgi:germination protein YpeB